jgi:hypothetical protein
LPHDSDQALRPRQIDVFLKHRAVSGSIHNFAKDALELVDHPGQVEAPLDRAPASAPSRRGTG